MSVHSLGGVSRNGSWKVAPRVAAMRPASAGEQCSRESSAFKITKPPSVERQSKAVQVPRASDTRELEKTRQSISKSTAVSRCLSRKQIVQPHRNLITDKHYNHIVASSSVTKTSEAITSRQHASFDGLCCPASSFSRDPAGSNNPAGTDRTVPERTKIDQQQHLPAPIAPLQLRSASSWSQPVLGTRRGQVKTTRATSTCPKGWGRMVVRLGANMHMQIVLSEQQPSSQPRSTI